MKLITIYFPYTDEGKEKGKFLMDKMNQYSGHIHKGLNKKQEKKYKCVLPKELTPPQKKWFNSLISNSATILICGELTTPDFEQKARIKKLTNKRNDGILYWDTEDVDPVTLNEAMVKAIESEMLVEVD